VAVIVSPIFAYPNGLRFHVNAFPNSTPKDPERFFAAFADGVRADAEDRLRFTVEYPDGSSAANFRRSPARSGALPEHPVLFSHSAMGGYAPNAAYWLWPLPEDGLEWIVEWPYQGISETRTPLDGAAVRDAAARARDVWD
jgi:hypothetical protein